MSTDGVHTLEHLLATFMREEIGDVIDVSPMGCRTGFYMITFGEKGLSEVKQALNNSLVKVLETEEVPATNEYNVEIIRSFIEESKNMQIKF